MHYAVEVPKVNYWSHVFTITALCIRVYGVVSKSLILINKMYLCVVNLHSKHWCPFAVLVLVLVLEPQVLDNNTGSHGVTCHPAVVTLPSLPQPKLVLDSMTLEGCKSELTWVVVLSQGSLAVKYGHLSQK